MEHDPNRCTEFRVFPRVSSCQEHHPTEPDGNDEAQELETMKQLRFLRETLEDSNEQVRRAGISASCRIMKDYWDMIPTHEVTPFSFWVCNYYWIRPEHFVLEFDYGWTNFLCWDKPFGKYNYLESTQIKTSSVCEVSMTHKSSG